VLPCGEEGSSPLRLGVCRDMAIQEPCVVDPLHLVTVGPTGKLTCLTPGDGVSKLPWPDILLARWGEQATFMKTISSQVPQQITTGSHMPSILFAKGLDFTGRVMGEGITAKVPCALYCQQPLLVHSFCMQHQVTWCALLAAIDNTFMRTISSQVPSWMPSECPFKSPCPRRSSRHASSSLLTTCTPCSSAASRAGKDSLGHQARLERPAT
jgi:hypothetical protein